MKYIYLLSIFYLFGCAPRIVQPVREQQVPVEVTQTVDVPIDTAITLPGKTNTGTAVITTSRDTSLNWDWGTSETNIDITPQDEGREATVVVRTIEKEKIIRITDTVRVQITMRDTVTIQPDCPATIPAMPAKDSNLLDWIWWIIAVVAALVAAFLSRKKQKT